MDAYEGTEEKSWKCVSYLTKSWSSDKAGKIYECKHSARGNHAAPSVWRPTLTRYVILIVIDWKNFVGFAT